MNRQQMISILSNMSDESLIKAMDAVGIDCCDEGMDYSQGSDAEGLESWNSREISVDDANKPVLFDNQQIIKQAQPMPMRRREYYQPEVDSDLAEFATMHDQGSMGY